MYNVFIQRIAPSSFQTTTARWFFLELKQHSRAVFQCSCTLKCQNEYYMTVMLSQRKDSSFRLNHWGIILKKIHERFICEGFYFIFVLCIVHTKEYMVSLILPLSFFLSFFQIHPKTWPQWQGFSITRNLKIVQNPKKNT